MSRLKPQAESLYGLPQPLSGQNPSPIIAKRDPSTLDTGYAIGQNWVNTVLGTIFELASVSAGSATWASLGTTTGSFATVNAATFNTTTVATAISLASGNVFTGTGSNAAVGFTFTPKGTAGLTLTTGAVTATNGNLVTGTAGKGLVLKSGANARIGQATLVAGTIAVANTSVTANTRVFVTRSSINGSVAQTGIPSVVTNPGVGFTINALDATDITNVVAGDASIIDWFLVESA